MSNFNDLPPANASNVQLLIMVRDLHKQFAEFRYEQERMQRQMADLREAFDTARAVVRIIKWLAAIGLAGATLLTAVRKAMA